MGDATLTFAEAFAAADRRLQQLAHYDNDALINVSLQREPSDRPLTFGAVRRAVNYVVNLREPDATCISKGQRQAYADSIKQRWIDALLSLPTRILREPSYLRWDNAKQRRASDMVLAAVERALWIVEGKTCANHWIGYESTETHLDQLTIDAMYEVLKRGQLVQWIERHLAGVK